MRARNATHERGKANGTRSGSMSAGRLDVNCLETIVLLNRGERLEARVLPVEAQFSPALGVGVDDLDGDGVEDVVLAQNFFPTRPRTSPYASGRGLLLLGDGTGMLIPVDGQESGLKVYGDARAVGICDFDRDGRPDVVITQNSGETKLYRNTGRRGTGR